MSLDALSVVVAFLAVIEVALGAIAVAVGVREARAPSDDASDARRPLLVLLGATLLVVAAASVPLLYLLLAGWVPRWPGVMCVEGVRRIGTGLSGPVGWLPALLSTLDWTKPTLVFLAGTWAVLRRGAAASAVRRAALAAVALGLVAVVDGAVETAYVTIPKQGAPSTSGCCVVDTAAMSRERGLTAAGADAVGGSGTTAAVFVAASTLVGIAAAVVGLRRTTSNGPVSFVAGLVTAAAASLPGAATFLVDVAAPKILGLPHHHCVWCAFAFAPETIVGTTLYLLAVFCTGWAFVARLAAGTGGSTSVRPLLVAASFGFLAAAAMSAVIMWGP